jgi:HEAT repeat protein
MHDRAFLPWFGWWKWFLGLFPIAAAVWLGSGQVHAQNPDPAVQAFLNSLPSLGAKVTNMASSEERVKEVKKALASCGVRTFRQLGWILLPKEWAFREYRVLENKTVPESIVRPLLLKILEEAVVSVVQSASGEDKEALATLLGDYVIDTRVDLITPGFYKELQGEDLIEAHFGRLVDFLAPLALNSKEKEEVRIAVVRAVGKIRANSNKTRIILETLLGQNQVSRVPVPVRRAAAESLVFLLQPPVSPERNPNSPRIPEPSLKEVVDFGEVILTVAATGLKDPDDEVRHLSVHGLEHVASALRNKLVPESARPELPKSGSTEPRKDELGALSKVKQKEYFKELVDALVQGAEAAAGVVNDSSPAIRLRARTALEEMGEVRRLYYTQTPSQTPEVIPDAPKPKTILREGNSQGSLREAELVLVVEKPSKERKPFLKALWAALRPLSQGLADPIPANRLAAAEAIESILPWKNQPADDTETSPYFAEAAQALVRALADSDRYVRWTATRALGRLGPIGEVKQGAVAALARILRDPDLEVRTAAAVALKEYATDASPAVPSLARAVKEGGDTETRLAAIRALVAIGEEAVPAIPSLAEALADPKVPIRQEAAAALGTFGKASIAAESQLLRALDDSDATVRLNASSALLQIRVPLPPKP